VWLFSSNATVFAGQVVTDDIRQWARQTVKAESSRAFKPADNTVAVLYFQNRTQKPSLDFLEMGMTIMLITDLAKLDDIQVVERTHLQALMDELKLGTSGLVSTKTAPRVGKLLSTYYLVYGAFKSGAKDTIQLGSDVLDLPKDNLLGNAASTGNLAQVIDMEKQILFEIIRLLRLDLTEAQKEALRRPITKDIKALEYLVLGVKSSDQGDYGKAADNYKKALEVDPDIEPAKSAIKELKDLGLIGRAASGNGLLRKLQKRASVNTGPIPDLTTRRFRSAPVSVLGLGGRAGVGVQW